MEAVFDLSLPTSWAELSDKMLRTVYTLFARDLSAAEVKTLCLMKWNKMTVLAQLRNHKYLVKRNRSQVIVSSKQIQQATCFLAYTIAFMYINNEQQMIKTQYLLKVSFNGEVFASASMTVNPIPANIIYTASKLLIVTLNAI